MKKTIAALLCLIMLFSLAGCSGSGNNTDTKEAENTESTSGYQMQKRETILSPQEYILLQNIHYNDQASDYLNKEVTKNGIFAILYDEYNNCERYYVWGYNDNTKCCDWQWEFIPKDKSSLPSIGSTIEVSGKFVENANALDSYLIENAEVKSVKEVTPSAYDVDTTSMGGTLLRVQVVNMQAHPDKFEGKSVAVYGRIETVTSVQHPYYDNCFSQTFESNDAAYATGTRVIVAGTYTNGIITNATVTVSNDF